MSGLLSNGLMWATDLITGLSNMVLAAHVVYYMPC